MSDVASYVMPPLSQALFESMHNKLVHFPIALTPVAVVVAWLARRRPELEPLAFWLVWTTAAATLAAVFSGMYAETALERDPKHWLAETHGNWSVAVGLAQAAWVMVAVRPQTKRFAWAWGLVVLGLVAVTSFVGGVVAHGK